MASSKDYYTTLGVLPDAEDIVVNAAYRALAMRYHPDRWQGDTNEGHSRMAEINEAYRVIGDPVRRAEYDRSRERNGHTEFTAENSNSQDEAFSAALGHLEERWQIACTIYPELLGYRSRLNKISTALAFAFVTQLLETKAFSSREQMAAHLEEAFLQRYFGTDERIIRYARSLILDGQKAAARALNKLVTIMGSDVDPKLIVQRVNADYGIELDRNRKHLIRLILADGYYDDARTLAEICEYSVETISKGFWRRPGIKLTKLGEPPLVFENTAEFIEWTKATLCR